LKLPAACRQRLPGAKLGVAVESLDQDPPAKRISIEIEWTGHGGVRSRPIRVTAWKHAKKEAAE
jgi:hypothetical protein